MTDEQIAAKVAVGVAESNLKAAQEALRKLADDTAKVNKYIAECERDLEHARAELAKIGA